VSTGAASRGIAALTPRRLPSSVVIRLARTPDTLIYAFRVAGEKGEQWHGQAGALPSGEYETGLIEFNPAWPGPFTGQALEVRYGPVDDEFMPPYLRAYALVNNRRVAATAAVQQILFGG
jgi:hypothetical protein